MKKIFAVFKTHVDVGFTHSAEEVIDSFSSKMPYAVADTCSRVPKFKWTMPAWAIYKAIRSNSKGAELAKSLIEQGQLTWHSLPFTTHTEFCGTEEFIRGLYFSKILSQQFNKPMPISAKMTDVPGHTWGLVSVLAKAGIKFLHLGCNPACMPPDVPMLFYWEGVDGSKILTFYNKGSYGSTLTPPDSWKFPVWLAMQQTNDNLGPQNANVIQEIYKQAKGFELILASLDEFYNALEPYLDEKIPIIKGDLADTWIHGVGTYPREVANLRELRYKLCKSEAKATLNGIVDVDINKAYENCLVFGEHTWGLDVKTYLGYERHYDNEGFLSDKQLPQFQKMEDSWQYKRKLVNSIKINTTLNNDFGETSALENNSLKVNLNNNGIKIEAKGTNTLFTNDNFGIIQYDIFSNQDITDFIRDYSYRFFDWSINDLGRMNYPEISHKKKMYDNMTVSENRLIQHCDFCKNIEIITSVHNDKPYIDLTYKIIEKIETPLVESCHILLPFNLKNDYDVKLSKMGSVVNIKNDIVHNANNSMYCTEKWINIFDDEKGVLIIPISNPLFSVGENMIYKFQSDYIHKKPVVFINLFNNCWGTNFPQWMGGDYEFKVRLYPYVGSLSDASIFKIANDTYSDFDIHNIVETEADIELLAFKPSLDDKGAVLRIKSISNCNQKITLTPKFDYKNCWYASLVEDKQYHFEKDIIFDSAPYEIHTIYFEREKA